MMNDVRIAEGGKLLAYRDKEWRDVTAHLSYYMTDECSVDDDVTVLDIISLIESHCERLSPILTKGKNWLFQLVEEAYTPAKELSDLEKISLSWRVSIQDDFMTKNSTTLVEYVEALGSKSQDSERYALSFTPLNKIAHCSFVLDKRVTVYDERSKVMKKYSKFLDTLPEEDKARLSYVPVMIKTNKPFTLYDILRGFFWEMTFHGPPSERDKAAQSIRDSIERVESGEEELFTWEEVKERIKKGK